jgi:RecA/RadA recombinase
MAKEESGKDKALNLTLSNLEKQYGKGIVMKLSDENMKNIESVSTGFTWARYCPWWWRIAAGKNS